MTDMTTKAVAIYYRVSGKEQLQGYSLDAQVRAIEAYCTQHGYEIVARYPEPARSARGSSESKRPAFNQMLSDAEARHFDVLIVHKLDRFARNLRVQLDGFDRLSKAGVGFISLNENLDYSSAMGRMMMAQMGAWNQFYSDNLAEETKKGKRERKAQGLYNGLLPFGVSVNGNGLPVLDTEAHYCDVATRTEIVPGRGLLLAFELAAAGKSDREIAKALTGAGYRTSGNRGMNPFTKDTVRRLLQNRFYLGELPDGSVGWMPGKHEALIDVRLFEKAEAARAANARQPRGDRFTRPRRTTGTGTPWALSGLAQCSCGASIVANSRPGGRRSLRCYGRTQGNGCDEPSFYEDLIDEQLSAILGRFAVPEPEQKRMLNAWRRQQSAAVDTAATRIRARHKMSRLKDLYLEGEIGKTEYQTRKAALDNELAALPAESDPDNDAGKQLMGFLANVRNAWNVATAEERNKIARQLFAEAIVENSTVVASPPRPDLLPFFQGVKWCLGGSDGDRFSTFRTFSVPADPSVFRFQTSDQLPCTARVGRHGLGPTTLRRAATPVALAS